MTSAGGAVLELGCHHDALLLVRIRPRPDGYRWHSGPVVRDAGHPDQAVPVARGVGPPNASTVVRDASSHTPSTRRNTSS
jgi:hypothetical protein